MTIATNSLPLPETGSPFASALLFALPALALAGGAGVAVAQMAIALAIVLVLALRFKPVWRVYRRHGLELAGVIAAFAAYAAVGLARALTGQGAPAALAAAAAGLGLLGLACIGVMRHLRPRTGYFWTGLCAAGMAAAWLALSQVATGRAAGWPAGAPALGELALVCGLMGLCGLGALRAARQAWLPIVAMLCGVVAFIVAAPHRWQGPALAGANPLDLGLLLLLYLAPLAHFVAQLRRPDRGQHPLALAGLVLVAAFIGFGLAGAAPAAPGAFYLLMVGSLSGMCLATRPTTAPRRILLTRTDNIGDVVLTLPLAGYLKQIYPQAEIVFLCRRYAAAVVAQCRHVDRVLTLEELGDDLAGGMARSGCDTVLFLYPRSQLAFAARRAGIARRVGTIRKAYHWVNCNRLADVRAKATPWLHEAQLSFKLLLPLGIDHVPSLAQMWQLYGLTTPRHPAADAVLAAPGFKLILHPKSNGNGREWPLEHYTALAAMLGPGDGVRVLVTGSAAEGELLAQQAPALLAMPHVENLCGRLDLDGFTALIGGCDGLVASGTGPLHLAAALGRPVAGLFPQLKAIGPERWAALGQRAHNLVSPLACPHCTDPARCACMLAITPQQVFEVVRGWRDQAALAA